MNSSYRIFIVASAIILFFTVPTIGYIILNYEELQMDQAKRLILYYNSTSTSTNTNTNNKSKN